MLRSPLKIKVLIRPPCRQGAYTCQTFTDGGIHLVGVKTHPPAMRLVPLPFQGRTKICVPRDGDDEKESPSPVEKGERTRLRVGGSHTGLTTRTRYCEKVTDKSYGRCKDLSTVHSDGPPSLSGKDKSLSPPAAAKGPVLTGGQVLLLGLGVMAALWLLFILLLQWHG